MSYLLVITIPIARGMLSTQRFCLCDMALTDNVQLTKRQLIMFNWKNESVFSNHLLYLRPSAGMRGRVHLQCTPTCYCKKETRTRNTHTRTQTHSHTHTHTHTHTQNTHAQQLYFIKITLQYMNRFLNRKNRFLYLKN